jgi:hypothetical protein
MALTSNASKILKGATQPAEYWHRIKGPRAKKSWYRSLEIT